MTKELATYIYLTHNSKLSRKKKSKYEKSKTDEKTTKSGPILQSKIYRYFRSS